MANIQVDPLFLEALDSVELDEDKKDSDSDSDDNKYKKEDEDVDTDSDIDDDEDNDYLDDDLDDKEDEEVSFISATDMKIHLCDFLKKNKSYKEKIEGLDEFLTEVLLQVTSRKKELEKDPSIAEKMDKEKDSDFFEMFYDIIYEGIAEDKLAFLNAYLESKSLDETSALVESTADPLDQLFGGRLKPEDIKNMSDEEKKELVDKSKDLSLKDRYSLFKLLGKSWKALSDDDASRAMIVAGAQSVNPALGFVAHLLTGGLKRG